jgi:hypothetical protein
MTTSSTYIRFFSPCGDSLKDEYVSVEEYMNSAPDTYQWDRDTDLYEYANGKFFLI